MESSSLQEILQQYEDKRQNAIKEVELKKQELYKKNKKLDDLEKELNSLSINTVKLILNGNIENKDAYLSNLKEKTNIILAQKNELLKSLGLSENYLVPNFSCSLCSDTGYIQENNRTVMCNCLKQELFNLEYNKANISNIDIENFDTFKLELYSDVPNKNLYESDLSPRENIKIIKKICENFIENFDNPEEKNLLFIGNTGLGKTFLSNCIAKEILKKQKTVLYQTAPIMFDILIDYQLNKSDSSIDIYNNLLTANLLIIDDLGTETMNKMKFTEFFNIINTRLLNQANKNTKTIISTNLSMHDLYNYYDERILSRLVGYFNICKFYGEDIRFKKIKK